MKCLAFDIEISNVFTLRSGEDLEKYAPFDISVAATQIRDGEHRIWHSRDSDGKPATNLCRDDARALLDYLDQTEQAGHILVAWNGLSFDLKWIGHVAGDIPKAAKVARRMCDPMFQFFMTKGFPVSLESVARGMGLTCRKLMDGADAPVQWRAGNHQAVCDYVLGDTRMTVEIVLAIARQREIAWRTQKGTRSSIPISRLRTVQECLDDPMPDQSWMSQPIPKHKFVGWLR
jgi:hypothetical protein